MKLGQEQTDLTDRTAGKPGKIDNSIRQYFFKKNQTNKKPTADFSTQRDIHPGIFNY